MIYLDSAATSFHKPEAVYEAVLSAMRSAGNADRGVNEASLSAAERIFMARYRLASLFHVKDPARIAFTSNSTESLNTAIKGSISPGDHVITTVLEHNSVLRPLYELMEKGAEVTFISCDDKGNLNYEELFTSVRENTKAVVTTHGSNLTGNLVDAAKIGAFTREKGLLYILDASQTAGVFDIDVEAMGIDILCFTGHKSLLGPQGTGGIYVREGINVRPLKSGGSGVKTYEKKHPADMPTALEAGTLNTHGISGLSAGADFILSHTPKKIRERELMLMRRFYEGVKDVPGVKIYGDFSCENRCPIVTLNVEGYDSATVGDWLYMDYEIAVRSGAHCAPLMHRALHTEETGAVRFSFSYFNTEEEIDAAVQAVREIAGQ